LIIVGLYTVTWASYKERQATVEISSHDSWVSEPLIHEKSAHQRDHIFSGPPAHPQLQNHVIKR